MIEAQHYKPPSYSSFSSTVALVPQSLRTFIILHWWQQEQTPRLQLRLKFILEGEKEEVIGDKRVTGTAAGPGVDSKPIAQLCDKLFQLFKKILCKDKKKSTSEGRAGTGEQTRKRSGYVYISTPNFVSSKWPRLSLQEVVYILFVKAISLYHVNVCFLLPKLTPNQLCLTAPLKYSSPFTHNTPSSSSFSSKYAHFWIQTLHSCGQIQNSSLNGVKIGDVTVASFIFYTRSVFGLSLSILLSCHEAHDMQRFHFNFRKPSSQFKLFTFSWIKQYQSVCCRTNSRY